MRTMNIDAPGVGPVKLIVDHVGIHIKVGRRQVTMMWHQFFTHASIPLSAPAKYHSSAEAKRDWLDAGRISRKQGSRR